jgi:hypothetical protein
MRTTKSFYMSGCSPLSTSGVSKVWSYQMIRNIYKYCSPDRTSNKIYYFLTNKTKNPWKNNFLATSSVSFSASPTKSSRRRKNKNSSEKCWMISLRKTILIHSLFSYKKWWSLNNPSSLNSTTNNTSLPISPSNSAPPPLNSSSPTSSAQSTTQPSSTKQTKKLSQSYLWSMQSPQSETNQSIFNYWTLSIFLFHDSQS